MKRAGLVRLWSSFRLQCRAPKSLIAPAISLVLFAGAIYGILPIGTRPAHFSFVSLIKVWKFAAGMVVIILFTTLMMQLDKILLSRLLPLDNFSYYALAALVG